MTYEEAAAKWLNNLDASASRLNGERVSTADLAAVMQAYGLAAIASALLSLRSKNKVE